MAQCTAKSKRTGKQCGQFCPPGQTVCKWHGGASPKGMASATYKTGRHSKYLPTRLLPKYHESVSDPDLLNLAAEIAVLDARLEDLFKRVDNGESDRLWRDLHGTYKDFRDAQRSGDTDEMGVQLAKLGKLITSGHLDAVAWAEIQQIILTRRRLVDTERRRRVDMQNIVTAEQAMLLVNALADSVRQHVKDTDALRRISDDFTRILSARNNDTA